MCLNLYITFCSTIDCSSSLLLLLLIVFVFDVVVIVAIVISLLFRLLSPMIYLFYSHLFILFVTIYVCMYIKGVFQENKAHFY